MAGSLNKVLLIGRLGADPDIKQMVNGKSVARLSLATSNTWKDKNTGERKEKTEWHRVIIFNEGLVNVVQQYVKKGAQVYIEGQLTTRKWRDEKSGTDKYSTEVVLQGFNSSFKILSSKSGQIESIQEPKKDKSSLPNEENIASSAATILKPTGRSNSVLAPIRIASPNNGSSIPSASSKRRIR